MTPAVPSSSFVPDWRLARTTEERRRGERGRPAWLDTFDAAYRDHASVGNEARGMLRALAPLMANARREVRAALAGCAAVADSQTCAESLEAGLYDRVLRAVSATIVLELGFAAENGLLEGETPERRFRFFCDCLGDAGFAGRLLGRHPVLARRLTILVDQWQSSTLTLARRFEADSGVLARQFPRQDEGRLLGVEFRGDLHRGGRSVCVLELEGDRKIVYKPRAVGMEAGFAALVNWLNERGDGPDLRAAATIDRRDYGWMDFAAAHPCADAAAVGRFFRRQGGNLAVAYVLGASDLHYENVIAAGEYPVVVDLETLFQPRAVDTARRDATAVAQRALDDSVLRTYLLPARLYGGLRADGARRGADVSAMGYVAGAETPYVVADWEGWGTDQARLVERDGEMPPADCLPQLEGARVAPAGHIDRIIDGFATIYDLLRRERSALTVGGGPLRRFAGREVRRIHRATADYLQTLTHSWHPRFGRDMALLEDDLRRRLGRATAPSVSAAEVSDLVRGDIPYFTGLVPARPRGRPVATSDVDQGWWQCRRRISALGETDKGRQAWLTQVSLATLDRMIVPPRGGSVPAGTGQLRSLAAAIGDRLCETAFHGRGGATWLAPILMRSENRLVPVPAGFDLYDGLSGVALFLGRLSVATGSPKYRAQADAAIREALSLYRRSGADVAPGAYEGVGGLAYALALLGRWLRRPLLRRTAVRIIRERARAACRDDRLDLVSGRAGFLLSGLAVGEITGDRSLVDVLTSIAVGLNETRDGDLPDDDEAGLAHGKAGIGLALSRWAHRTGDARALARGRALLGADIATSADARDRVAGGGGDDRRGGLIWCRGGVGAALAMLRESVVDRAHVSRLVHEIADDRRALASTGALCLCHGAAGALDFLGAAKAAKVPGAARTARSVKRMIVSRVASGERCSDFTHSLEAPGLMLGMAGTGYTLLRLLNPTNTPSVLTLEAA